MFLGYIQNNQPNKAIDLFYEINKPNDIIFILIFKACAQLEGKKASNLIQSFLSKMPTPFYSNPHLVTSLIHALINCGDVTTAEILFNKLQMKDVSIYGAMMKGRRMIVLLQSISSDLYLSIGYVRNKQANKAIDLFHQMKKHNHIIYILLLNACAQLQTKEALDLVKQVSSDMPKSYQLDPNLITSLVDALLKCGDVESAEVWFHQTKSKHSSLCNAMMKGKNNIEKRNIYSSLLVYFRLHQE